MKESLRFEITPIKMGRTLSLCPPKKRPRFCSKNGKKVAYHETNYVAAQEQVLEQLERLNLPAFSTPCEINVTFYGDLSADGDNAIGFLFDVFVLGGYLPNDNTKNISAASFQQVPVAIPTEDGKRFKKKATPEDKKKYWGIIIKVSPAVPMNPVNREAIEQRIVHKAKNRAFDCQGLSILPKPLTTR